MNFYKSDMYDEDVENLLMGCKNLPSLMNMIWYLTRNNCYTRKRYVKNIKCIKLYNDKGIFKVNSRLDDVIRFHFKKNLKQKLNSRFIIEEIKNEI